MILWVPKHTKKKRKITTTDSLSSLKSRQLKENVRITHRLCTKRAEIIRCIA